MKLKHYVKAAKLRQKDGALEFDCDPAVSVNDTLHIKNDEDGAYVQAWVWIPREDAVQVACDEEEGKG